MQHAARNYMTVPDQALIEMEQSIPAFQVDGKFSRERYDVALQNERMSPETFDAALRRDLTIQQLSSALADSGFASKAAAERLARLRAQQREISEQRIQADRSGCGSRVLRRKSGALPGARGA
jgi:peptidyl-prolyl cis-trans isomerase D